MTHDSSSITKRPTQVPQIIAGKLARLRRKLRGWILVQGLGRWLMIVLGVLVADMAIDRMFKMDFAQRSIMLAIMFLAAVYFLFRRVLNPLTFRAGDDALAYEVENEHQELNESLISALQLSREQDLEGLGVSSELATATIRQGVEHAESLDFNQSLDRAQNVKNWALLLAGAGALALIGFGVTQHHFLQTWFNRNILLGSAQWPQTTYLRVVGAEQGRLTLPRGADRRQLVEITEDSRMTDVVVTIEVDSTNGRAFHTMKPTGKLDGRQRVFVFHNVSSAFRFRAAGGDDQTDWIEVDLVEPPSIAKLDLQAQFPDYTGMEPFPLEGSGPHSLLIGSRLMVTAGTNKPVNECEIRRGDEAIGLQPSADGLSFSGVLPTEEDQPLMGGEYQFHLVDQTGLASTRPAKFEITLREDKPPKVNADLLGISGLVVPRAMLPVQFAAKDEFSIARMLFACSWKASEEADAVGRNVAFGELPGAANGLVRQIENVEILDLIPLQLNPGTSFRFAVEAFDNRPGDPNVGRSQEFLLRIVTDEELRADLLRREIEQRRAFEQAYNAQLELMSELQAVVAMRPEPNQRKDEFDSDRDARMLTIGQGQNSISTSIVHVADRFEAFLVEVKNNRLDDQENELAPEQRIEKRFDEGIIQPIRQLDQELIVISTRQLENCRRLVQDQAALDEAVQPAVAVQQEILDRMKRILDAMTESENFQEVINKLLEIKGGEENIKKEIEKRSQPKNIFDEDNDDIFDNGN